MDRQATLRPDMTNLLAKYQAVRARTVALAHPLSPEDQMVQSMPDASPTKWHLAHTSWFFENFVLAPRLPEFRSFDAHYGFLFNSYYEAVGERVDRARRGLLSRPALADIHAYRTHVDEAMLELCEREAGDPSLASLIELGLNHEQQHQELLLTDIKHVLGGNPLRPLYHLSPQPLPAVGSSAGVLAADTRADFEGEVPERFVHFDEGIAWIGHDAKAGEQAGQKAAEAPAFAFDNEGPRHRVFLRAFTIADRPVTCGAYLSFMSDGGYTRPELWLSDGWQMCTAHSWRAPLYWEEREGHWTTFTLGGTRLVDAREPVIHVSYYEADAFARWARARLPTEQEWEHAADRHAVEGHFADRNHFHPGPSRVSFYGDVWQWTQSPYAPYPGFRPVAGAIGEYNGKFMCNQMVLRGGSCLTPPGHVRATYRNFFPPAARWQATGIRLAKDA